MNYFVKVNDGDFESVYNWPVGIMPDLDSALLLVYICRNRLFEDAYDNTWNYDMEILEINEDGSLGKSVASYYNEWMYE